MRYFNSNATVGQARIGGNAFGALCSDTLSVGASTAIFGLSGAYLAYIILNTQYLSSNPERMCKLIMFILFSLLLTIMLGGKNVDTLGHLGGFITGFFVGFYHMPCVEKENDRQARAKSLGFWFKIVFAIWFVSIFTFFYTLRTPQDKFGSTKTDSTAVNTAPESSTEESTAQVASEPSTLAQVSNK